MAGVAGILPVFSMFEKFQSIAGKASNIAAQLQEKTVNEYLPLIAKILREKAGPAVLDILNDPSRMTELSRTAYQTMPMPVRMAIKEDAFNSAVLAHKGKLITLIQSQIEAEHDDQAENLVVEGLKHEGPGVVDKASRDGEPSLAESEAEDDGSKVHQVMSIADSEETSNTTSPST